MASNRRPETITVVHDPDPPSLTEGAAVALLRIRELDERFRQIIAEGTGETFKHEHNERWLAETRPMLEAFWHADFMLRMAVRHGRELGQAPNVLPSGWAALLYLYGRR